MTVSTSSDTTAVQTNAYAITAAKAVSSPTVALSTTAAGATNVTYNVRFTTSSTGALAPYYSTITLAAPAGTNFSTSTTYTIEDLTTGSQCGYYTAVPSNGGATVTLSTYSSCGTIAGGDTVLVTASQVSNPTTTSTSDVVTVSTSSDTTAVQTNTYAITAAQAMSSPTVALSSTAAGATDVAYSVRFTTSSTGALAPYYSAITLAAPTGTDFTPNSTYTIEDLTTGSQCGYYNAVTSNGGATVVLNTCTGCGTIAGGDTVLVTASLVSNPSAASTGNFVTVSTSSDTTAVHTNTYAITAPQAVSSPSVTLSTTAAGATNVTYTASFTTSSTGALAPYYSTITLAAPTGTNFTSSSFTIEDITTATQCGFYTYGLSNGGATVTLSPYGYCGTIAGGDTVLITATSVSNPATASTGDVVVVTTSSDTEPAQTNTYSIGSGGQSVTSPSVTLSTAAAGATNVTYDVKFTTTPSGSLAAGSGTITLAAPAETVFSSNSYYTIEDITTGPNCGLYNWVTSNSGATVTLTVGSSCGTIAGGATVLVTASGVTNPTATSTSDVVAVSTSSDTTQAHTNTYAITPAQAPASPSVTLSTTAAGATNVTYTTSFTTSSTGALAPYYSTITLAAPAGTVFSSNSSYTIEDVTTATQCGLNNWVTSNSDATVTLTVGGGCTVEAGDTLQVTASGVSNPTMTSTGDVVAVSTSSDTAPGKTNTYAITAAKAVSSPSVTLSTTAAGATDVTYTTSFTTSSTGALAPYYSTITLAAPAGTVFSSNSSYTIEDITTATNSAGWRTG